MLCNVNMLMSPTSCSSVHREGPAVLLKQKDLWRDVVSLSVLLMWTLNSNTQGQDQQTLTYFQTIHSFNLSPVFIWQCMTAVCSALILTNTSPYSWPLPASYGTVWSTRGGNRHSSPHRDDWEVLSLPEVLLYVQPFPGSCSLSLWYVHFDLIYI